MSFRKILIPLTGRPTDDAALFAGFALGRLHKAHIEACLVLTNSIITALMPIEEVCLRKRLGTMELWTGGRSVERANRQLWKTARRGRPAKHQLEH